MEDSQEPEHDAPRTGATARPLRHDMGFARQFGFAVFASIPLTPSSERSERIEGRL